MDTTETHWSVDLAVHTAVTLVRYGHYRDTLVSRLSCSTAVTLVRYGHYRDTLVSRLSCSTAVTLVRYGYNRDTLVAVPQQLHWSDTDTTETHWSVDLAVHTAVTLVRYGHYRDTLVSRLSCTYSSYTGQIRTLQRHTGQST